MHAERTAEQTWVGKPLRRFEDRRLLTGAGTYVDDVRLPDAAGLAILRSPYPHALLKGLDISAALAAEGVIDIVTGDEVRGLGRVIPMQMSENPNIAFHQLLVDTEARYVGEPVAAILADTAKHARDAVDLIEADWDPLPTVTDAEEALAEGSPLVHDDLGTNLVFETHMGSTAEEVAPVFESADRVISVRLQSARINPVTMEPRTIAIEYLADQDRYLIHASTQRTFGAPDVANVALNIPKEKFDVLAIDVGGGFGAKGAPYREEMLAVYLAHKHQRSVRWTATRSDDFLTMAGARDQVSYVEGAFRHDGKLLAMRVRSIANLGAYLYIPSMMVATGPARLSTGAYDVPLSHNVAMGVYTNRAPTGPYRGAGRPEGTMVAERLMDTAAREMGIDPVAIRRLNFVQPDQMPYRTPMGSMYDSGDYEATMDAALELAGYDSLVKQRDEARARGEIFGIGLCTFVEPAGAGFESGRVRVERDGSIVLESGSFAHGQGHITTFAQIVADTFKTTPDRVTVVQGDSRRVPVGVGTFGSRSTMSGGGAGRVAATKVMKKMVDIAGSLLEVQAEDVEWDGSTFHPSGVPVRGVTFMEVVEVAYDPARLPEGMEPGLEANERYSTDGSFPHGTHIAAVSIDRDTGKIKHEAFVAVDDAGIIINPLLAEAQIVGGLAQGFGQALIEEMVYDEDGTLLAASFGDYAVPRASDLPNFVLGETCSPAPGNVLGVKGLGESGTVGAPPALANAVMDALTGAGCDVKQVDFPITAPKIWEILGAR